MQNKNTKFYSSTIDDILRNIKYNTLERVTENDETLIISKTGNFQIKNKTLLSKINSSFQEMGLPIPRLIVN